MYAASLMAGERSGNLDAVIRRYVAYEKVIGAVKRRTISALIYPAILVVMMIGLIGIIVLRVVPAFSELLRQLRPRAAAVHADHRRRLDSLVVTNLWLILIGVRCAFVVGVAGVGAAARAAGARRSRCCCGCRGRATTVRKFATAQFARTLATLLGGGIPLVNALEIGGPVDVQPLSRRDELDDVTPARAGRSELRRGACSGAGVFPDVAVKMVEVGESTGALQEMLNSLADFYDEEIETEVARFITLIEPVMLVIMGVVIAVVVLALYMPLFELSSVVAADRDVWQQLTRTTSSSRPRRTTPRRSARARQLAERYRLEFVDMDEFRIDQELFRSIPADLMLRYGFVPYRRDGKSLVIVVSDPTDLPMIDELGVVLGTPIKVTVGAPSAIQSILKKSESSQRVLEDATEGSSSRCSRTTRRPRTTSRSSG